MMRSLLSLIACLGATLSLAQAPPAAGLAALDAKGQPKGTCPLEHTDVQAVVSGYVSRVTVTQRFGNPFTERIEAIYTFPLPHDGAVFDMEMKVGERVIRGLIKKREDAAKIYQQARAAGQTAALLDQERPNIFTQSVANIRPGEKVEVRLRYTALLPYKDGRFSFVFPMVVGPRYMPGQPTGQSGTGWSPDTTGVPDASRISPPVTPKGTRAGHDISLSLNLAPGLPLGEVRCTSHEADVARQPWGAQIKLRRADEIPNKDFVLEYTTSADQIGDAVLSQTDSKGPDGYFALVLAPPARVTPEQAVPKEIVFVLDTSGSMQGFPIQRAKESMSSCIEQLNPHDTFNLITFSGDTSVLFEQPVPASDENIVRALTFLRTRSGGGGTEMMKAVEAALRPSAAGGGVRIVCFMTDGYVGNDRQIIDAIGKYSSARVFSFGIGSSVNRFLLDGMARAGRGEVEYVPLSGPQATTAAKDAAARFAERVRNPVLTDITLDWGDLPVADVQPARLPDLFSAKPMMVVGRFTKPASGSLTIRGKTAAGAFERKLAVKFTADDSSHQVLPQVWARTTIEALSNDDLLAQKPETKERITQLGLDYRLMTAYTSFVAVEERTTTENGVPKTVVVPVEMPEGVSYEGVFGNHNMDVRALGGASAMPGLAAAKPAPVRSAPQPTVPPMSAPAMPAPVAGGGGFGGMSGSGGAMRFSREPHEAASEAGLSLPAGNWPATISLELANTPLREALAQVTGLTGLKMVVGKDVDADEPLTLSLKSVPTAQAIAAICGAPRVCAVEAFAGRLMVTKTGGRAARAEATKLLPWLLKADAATYAALSAGQPLSVRLTVSAVGPVTAKLAELKAEKVVAAADGKSVTAVVRPDALVTVAALAEVTGVALNQ
ncbi:MAG: VWA domain-containing protein [Armatimonadetes bacterium]|nr:VWA domain-containing protein [Armatimonadota bacterium]